MIIEKMRELLTELERWQPQIELALHHGRDTHTFDDVVGMILNNRLFFYSFPKAFVIMELVDYPQFKVFHCFLAGGELTDVLACTMPMSKVAKELDCRYISIAGRKGWHRLLDNSGWNFVCTTMYLTLDGQNGQRQN